MYYNLQLYYIKIITVKELRRDHDTTLAMISYQSSGNGLYIVFHHKSFNQDVFQRDSKMKSWIFVHKDLALYWESSEELKGVYRSHENI